MLQMTIGKPIGAGSGKISALNFSDEDASQLSESIEHHFLVATHDDAPGCCIDGRACSQTLGGTKPVAGPSVSGGPTITAYAAAEIVGDYFSKTSGRISLARVDEVNSILTDGNIVLGAHVSRGALVATNRTFVDVTGQSKTGCGANDEFRSILNRLSDSAEVINGLTENLLGSEFNPAAMQFKHGKTLLDRVADYRSVDVLQAIAVPAQGKNVEILEGEHAESLVVFSYVKDRTVDRDALVAETGKQVFVVDMWYLNKLAHVMAQGRPDAPEMYGRLHHAMVVFQVATYLTLCDGTQRPLLFKQTQAREATALAN